MNGTTEPDIPPHVKLGKAKAMEVVILPNGTRLLQKAKVRYWVERRGAREDFMLVHDNKVHHLNTLEFKRKFKVIIKGGEVNIGVSLPPE